ncbi:MAG: transglutaminase-like domain-containing protein [Candidatus Micrarchaeota archaeon]|nr:transglutaminase-like domain-containing protein [Candidatus Micrarchaeota archaeon]
MRKAPVQIFLLLVFGALSAEALNPRLAHYSSVLIDESGQVSIEGGEIKDLAINLTIPPSRPYQQVQANDKVLSDPLGNSFISIKASNPPNPFYYSRQVLVKSYSRTTKSLPERFSPPPDAAAFLSQTNRTQSNDRAIQELAFRITENATSQFEKAALLAIFVHNHINYTESLVGKEKDALWVLENRQGVCTEYSTLFVAMARAIGIPARYVTGYVYSDKFEGWMGHAWAEVFLGDWVPVDPTWFEVGSLDALHIETGRHIEISHEPSLHATVTNPDAKLSWSSTGRSGAFAKNIKTLEAQASAPISSFDLASVSSRLSPGSSTLVFLTMAGEDYRAVPVSLASCVGQKVVDIFPREEQYLILEPGKNATAVWQIVAADNLDPRYIYTCALTLNSPYLERRSLEIKVDSGAPKPGKFSALLQNPVSLPGNPNSVAFSLPPSMAGKRAYVVTPEGVFSTSIMSNSERIEFALKSIGKIPIYAAVEDSGYRQLLVQSEPNISMSISSFTLPSYVLLGQPLAGSARISSKSYPANFSLLFLFGGKKTASSGKLDYPQDFEISYLPENEGEYLAKIQLLSPQGEVLDEKSQLVLVFEQPDVSIRDVKLAKDSYGIITTIYFSISGQPVSPVISLNGIRYRANDTLRLRIPEGEYEVELSWSDKAGNSYFRQAGIKVSDPKVQGILEGLKEKPKQQPSSRFCPVAFAVFASALAIAIARR